MGFLDIAANFHVVTEWHPVDNPTARQEINKRRRHHHNSKTSFLSNLQDHQNNGPRDELVDDSKEAAVAELGEASAVCVLVGPIFIPFFIMPKMDWLFWGWLKAFIGFSFYQVIASAFIFIFAKVLLGLLAVIGPITLLREAPLDNVTFDLKTRLGGMD